MYGKNYIVPFYAYLTLEGKECAELMYKIIQVMAEKRLINLYQKNSREIRSCEKENCIETETLNYDKR